MEVTVVVLSILLATTSLASGAAKITGTHPMRADAERFGFSYTTYRLIGLTEVAAAAGLITGLFAWPLGVAAAVGIVCLMAGAVTTHLRARDPRAKLTGAVAVAALATAIAILQVATQL
jgi:uncharacterized membrane protein YphA (DoxX/SURF4 family)